MADHGVEVEREGGVPDLRDWPARIRKAADLAELEVDVRARVDSTNRVLLEQSHAGVTGRRAVVADAQDSGRGRMGRQWSSPPGLNLYLSLLHLSHRPLSDLTLVPLVVACGARAAIGSLGWSPGIKWPNDLLAPGSFKKLGGILVEVGAQSAAGRALVIGIGVNVNLEASQMPETIQDIATSLRIEAGILVERPQLAGHIIKEVYDRLALLEAGSRRALLEEWRSASLTLGRCVRYEVSGREIEGEAIDIDADGALMVRGATGVSRVTAGDVQLLSG